MSATVVLADGEFPKSKRPLSILEEASTIICCDGAVASLIDHGFEPDAIVGDMDSISDILRDRYKDRIYPDKNEDNNDLTKTVEYCHKRGEQEITILGATGKREDHTIGNISLLCKYKQLLDVTMVTDQGVFTPIKQTAQFNSFPGQQVSFFSLTPGLKISTSGLKYPLNQRVLGSWWMGTLNECLGDSFCLEFDLGDVVVYQVF